MTRSPERPLRIVVADDQASVREGLVLLLGGLPDIDVVGAAADGQQALELVADRKPDAILRSWTPCTPAHAATSPKTPTAPESPRHCTRRPAG